MNILKKLLHSCRFHAHPPYLIEDHCSNEEEEGEDDREEDGAGVRSETARVPHQGGVGEVGRVVKTVDHHDGGV